MVSHVLDVFERQPVKESSESNLIEKRYPKFLSKYKLINLQFRDIHFRETFMIQILILFQSLKQPINIVQKKYFRIPDKKELAKIKSRINKLLENGSEINHKDHRKSRDDESQKSREEIKRKESKEIRKED